MSAEKHKSDKHRTQNSEHCGRHNLVYKNTSHVLLVIRLKIYCHYLENIKTSTCKVSLCEEFLCFSTGVENTTEI
jgi:hypothetical protein